MIKRIVLIFVCGLGFISYSFCQNFLNGSFEINNSSGCQFGISNTTFDSIMIDVKAIGNYEMISIYDTSGCYTAEDGRYAINLMHSLTPLVYDAVSLKLTDSLHAGMAYNISFYQYYFFAVNADTIEIGLSDNDSTYGTLASVSPSITVPNTWIQRIVSFIAPITGNFITVRPRFIPGANFNYLDNFSFDTTTAISDLQSPTSNLQIFPNPATGTIQITINIKHNAPLECEIINMMGERVFTSPLTPLQRRGESYAALDVSFLAKGIYLVRVGDGERSENRKLVIE